MQTPTNPQQPRSDVAVGTPSATFDPANIQRPAPVLLKYYLLVSIATGPAFPIAFIPLLCKYLTLHYKFEKDGVSMKWGVLFRREINLTYRRIQDIHLTNNIFQRWLGLANVAIQTASGSSAPEMTIEGVLEAEHLRDYLYAEMRGAKGLDHPHAATHTPDADQTSDQVTSLLREIRDALIARGEPTGTNETQANVGALAENTSVEGDIDTDSADSSSAGEG